MQTPRAPRSRSHGPRRSPRHGFNGHHVNNFSEFCALVKDMIRRTGHLQAAITNDKAFEEEDRRRTKELQTIGLEYTNTVTVCSLRAAAYCQENGVFNPFDDFLDIVEEMDQPEQTQFYLDLANANDDPLQNITNKINEFHNIRDDFESVQAEILRRENEEKVSQAVATEKARADSAVDALAAAGAKERSSCFSMPAVEVDWLLLFQAGCYGSIALLCSVIPPALEYAGIHDWYLWWPIAFILVVFIAKITNMCFARFVKFLWSNIKQLFEGLVSCCLDIRCLRCFFERD